MGTKVDEVKRAKPIGRALRLIVGALLLVIVVPWYWQAAPAFLLATLAVLLLLTYLGVSLVVTGLRSDAGCEVMAIPGLVWRRRTRLACIVFSPIDWLEGKAL